MEANRFEEGLEVLQRLRAFDPPAPEEDVELTETEMTLRIRWAKQLGDEGRFDQAMREVKRVRERFSGWSAPYRVGFRCLKAQGDSAGAIAMVLAGFRNTGQPDLLQAAYELQVQATTPVELLAQWDDALGDLSDDGWYLLTTGWIALRHGIVEEGVKRLQEIASDDPAYAHAQIVMGGMNVERGHVSDGSAMLVRGNWPWIQIPFVWNCGNCGQLERYAPVNCNGCGAFQSYRLTRPYTIEEPAVAKLVSAYVVDRI